MKKKKSKAELKAGVAAQVPDVPLCPVCNGEGKKVLSDDGTVKKVQTCGICEGSGEQPPEWDEACKRAGVPMGSDGFCRNLDTDCSMFAPAANGNKHHCANVKHKIDLEANDAGWALKCESCLSDISARVLKIRAKNADKVEASDGDNQQKEQSVPPDISADISNAENIVTEKTHIPLIVTASSDRMLELGKRLADYEVEKANIEARKKAKVAEFNGEIAEIEASIAEIAPQVAAGGEMQPVECTITFDMNSRKKTCTRDDNGAEVWQHDFSTEDLKKFSLLAKNPLDGTAGKTLHDAMREGVESTPYERACKELGIPGGVTCKGEVFCENHEFTDEFRHCTKHSVNLDAEMGVAKKCYECVVEIEVLGATLEQKPVRDDTDLTNAFQCNDCGHIQGKDVSDLCVKCSSDKLEEYAPEPVESGVEE